jgi:hypothetical protein
MKCLRDCEIELIREMEMESACEDEIECCCESEGLLGMSVRCSIGFGKAFRVGPAVLVGNTISVGWVIRVGPCGRGSGAESQRLQRRMVKALRLWHRKRRHLYD